MLRHALRAGCSFALSTPNSAVTLRQLGQPQTTFLHNTASLMPIQARAPAAAAAALDALQCGRVGVCTSASTATATAAALAAQPQLRDEQHSVPGHGAAQQPPPAASPPRKRQRTVPKQPTLTGKAPPAASAAKQRRRGGGGATAPEEGKEEWNDLGEGAKVWYGRAMWPAAEASDLLHRLQEEVQWEHREVRVMGRTVMQPRLIAYMADDASLTYTYSSLRLTPSAWSPAAKEIKDKLEQVAGARFDSCLLNLYRDGGHHMGWHSDNELLYGREPVIGSASFGATRDFLLRHNQQRDRKLRFLLGNGDALVMAGTTQDHWMHAVPKRAAVPAPRINLTFRKVVHRE